MSNLLIEIEVEVITNTDMAICIENLKGENVWIAYSLIDDYSGDRKRPDTIFIPEYIAIKKDLI